MAADELGMLIALMYAPFLAVLSICCLFLQWLSLYILQR